MKNVLVIQTAFIGDAILGTALLQHLHTTFPESQIDYLVRDGNQSLFTNHPFLRKVLVWDKKNSKYAGLLSVLKLVRNQKYDAVYNIQRFAASGFITALSGAKQTIGYSNNPLSFMFTKSVKHRFGRGFESVHEVDRVLDLVEANSARTLPKLFPSEQDQKKTETLKDGAYITIAPASVWFTKQVPIQKWVELINQVPESTKVYLIGAKSDEGLADEVAKASSRPTVNLAGKLKLLETAALLKDSVMNYANDSAPIHLASAVNAPMCEVFCSTVPEFGFTPLSDKAFIVQTEEKMNCRPCGMHGKAACPKGHFNCANSIDVNQMISAL